MRLYKLVMIVVLFFTAACSSSANHTKEDKSKRVDTEVKQSPNQNPTESLHAADNTPIPLNISSCEAALEFLGGFSDQEGGADYQSGERIFPLLHFILTKQAVPAVSPEQEVYMKDNPIFVTNNSKYEHLIAFATIHSKRTGALHGVVGYPDNEVINYYLPMVLDVTAENKEIIPSVEIGSSNEIIPVNRQTWSKELSSYTQSCNDELVLPPTQENTERVFLGYNGKLYPFSKEIDFVAGVEAVGFQLAEIGNSYPGENKIQIPILLYCPQCKIENVTMIQDGKKLKFKKDEYYKEWQQWLGKEWHAFTSEQIDFDEDKFKKADFDNILSALPPFISDNPSTIQATINGELVTFINH